MAKVIVYEDSTPDLVGRYARLTQQHDVHVRFVDTLDCGFDLDFYTGTLDEEYTNNSLQDTHHFKPENMQVIDDTYDPTTEQADVYFLDGLQRRCFDIITALPNNRAFINSTNENIRAEARSRGFNVVGNESVEQIVERLSPSQ